MAKVSKPITNYLVYGAVRAFVAFIQAIPQSWAFGFAKAMAFVVHLVDKRHRKVAAENLTHAFPEKYALADSDPSQQRALARHIRAVYDHFCLLLVEMILLPGDSTRKLAQTPDHRPLRRPHSPVGGRKISLAYHLPPWQLGNGRLPDGPSRNPQFRHRPGSR